MNKLEVGIYYRYKEVIGKYIKPDLGTSYFTNQNKYGWHEIANGGRFSFNIIDLVQVGDYVNGEKVIKIYNPTFLSMEELPYVVTEDSKYENYEIKSIVTKEMYSNVEYRVEAN